MGVDAGACGSADDGVDADEEIGAPIGSEAARDFPIGGDRPEFTLGTIVVGVDQVR